MREPARPATVNHEPSEANNRLRRRIVQALGAAVVMPPIVTEVLAATDENRSARSVRVQAFPLSDVRLSPGPFLSAQQLDERYLLRLEPDRLLHNFRVNAGIAPKAPVYGGWESQEPWVEIRCHGHTLGHYLTACSLMFESTGDAQFKRRADYIVSELAACQEASKSGLICAFPDGVQQLVNSVQGKEFLGVPWYTMHKVLAGLRDAHLHAKNAVALTVFTRLADALGELTLPLDDEQMQKMLEREHGGMNEVLADLSALTHDAKYLDLATKFSHRALLAPLSGGRDLLDGLHSNTQIPKVIGFQRLYELTGREDYRRAAEFFWKTIVAHRTYATGGNGDIEHFFPPREFEQRLQSAKTMETCCMHNMLRLTRALFAHDPSVAYADYYERTLFNGILASQDPDSGMMTYFQATRPGYVKLYCTPIESFWCCTGSGMENHAKYGDSIYFHDGNALYVNLFIASNLRWHEQGMQIEQSTRFPNEPRSSFGLRVSRPKKLALHIRQPAWCSQVTVSINGTDATIHNKPGQYIELERTWRNGDRIDVELPMRLHLELLPNAPNIAALMYGPIVLAGRLGTQGVTREADLIVNERQSGEMLHIQRELPSWSLDRHDLDRQIKQSNGGNLAFTARGIAGFQELQLIPYHAIAHERYNLYWRLV
jgi:DUF1680 family protein